MAKPSEGIINAVKIDPFDPGSTERKVGKLTEEEVAKYNEKQAAKQAFKQARKMSNAIIDRNISDMQNEIQQGENLGAEAHKNKKEDSKSSIAELTGDKKVVKVSPLPSKKEIAAKQKEQSKGTKKEKLVNPDTVPSGATAKPSEELSGVVAGTKNDPDASHGLRANEHALKAPFPEANPDIYENKIDAIKNLANKRNERDEFIETARQDKKTAKRNMRERSIISDDSDLEDDFDLGDEFVSTDPFIASLFKKVKINKLLKDQIKEQYPDQIAEIIERVNNDPANASLSGRERRKLINEEITKFVVPLWKEAGGDTQVTKIVLSSPIAATIKNVIDGSAQESTKKMHNDKRAALEKKQNRSLEDQLYLDAFNMIEKGIDTEKKIAKLKGEVKDASNNLTSVNRAVRQHEKEVEKVRAAVNPKDRTTRVVRKNGFDFFYTSGDGAPAQYAAHAETKDGKKKYVVYSVTGGSPDTDLDPVKEFDYEEYKGENDPNVINAKIFAEENLGQIRGGRKGLMAKGIAQQKEKDFETLDGQNYFDYSKAHMVIAPKILKTIIDLGGKIDRNTGKIYSVSKDNFPEGADELYLDYVTALKLAKGDDEEVAKLTGMSLEEVKERRTEGMVRVYKVGDARVIKDEEGRIGYQLPDNNITGFSGKYGSGYINWNNPENRKVVEKYAKMGKTKQDIPLSELKTVNTSRSSEGNIDWADKKKTSAAERDQMTKYTGAYKPSRDILDALIGFGRK